MEEGLRALKTRIRRDAKRGVGKKEAEGGRECSANPGLKGPNPT